MSNLKSPSGWPLWLLRIVLTIFLGVFVIAGVALVTLPMLSDLNWVKESLLDMLEESAGGPIHIDHLEVHLLPSPQIFLTGLTFTSATPSHISLQAKKIELALGWESLWQHHLVLTRGTIQEPEMTIQIPRVSEPEEPEAWTFPDIKGLTIHNGRLHLLRESGMETSAGWTWEDIQITLSEINPDGQVSIYLNAQSQEADLQSSVLLQGTLMLIDQSEIIPAETMRNGIPAFFLSGHAEISQVNLSHLMSFLSDNFQEATQTRLSFQGKYELSLNQDTQNLSFPTLQISLDEWNFTGRGRLTDLNTETPYLKVSGSANSIGIGQLATLLPPQWVPTDVQNFLKDRKVDGTLELLNGSLQGPLNQQGPLRAEGVVRLKQGRLFTAAGHPPITQLSGTVAFDPNLIRILNVQGVLTPFTFGVREANLQIKDEDVVVFIPRFQITEQDWTLTGKASFTKFDRSSPILAISGSAPPISIKHLIGLLPATWMPTSIRTVLVDRQVEGIMELLTGSVTWTQNDEEPLAAEGVIRLTQGQVLVDPNHPPLTQVNGSIAFNSHLVRILDVQGELESSKLHIKEATLELGDLQILTDLQGGVDIETSDIIQALHHDPRTQPLAKMIDGYRDGRGGIRIATHIQGPLTHPERLRILQGSLAVDQVTLIPKENWLPVTGLTGQMMFDHRHMAISRLRGHIGNSPVEITGQGKFRNEMKFSNLTVRSNLAASDLVTLYPSLTDVFSTFAGSLGTIFTLSGTPSSITYQLHMDLTDWDLASTGILTKPALIPGTFDATGNILESRTVIIDHGELSFPPFHLDVKGNLAMRDPPHIGIGLQTESGTGALLPEGMSLGDKRLGLSTLAVALALQGQNWDWTAWNIEGSVEATDRVRLSERNAPNHDRKIFKLTWMQKDEKAKADFSVSNLLIERIFPSDPVPPLTGRLDLDTSMDLNLSVPEWVQRLSKGHGSILLEKGRILTTPVLSKILSLLNLHSVLMGKINVLDNGFPVDRLTGTFVVEDGILSSKDLALKSPVMALAAAGTYNIPTDEIDTIVTVSPFGAYSSLLKSIPLFGTLMEGDRKGLTTALFEVKGRRTDPRVTYLPFQSLTGGIMGLAKFPLDVLKNVLTLPVPDKDKTGEGEVE